MNPSRTELADLSDQAGSVLGPHEVGPGSRRPDATLPLVSIGFPVYNGSRTLRAALDSLLVQDYPNFELIISDNASTDETPAICREYAARSPMIAYHRVDRNMGALWNFNHVFALSRGKYFVWAADDDLRHPQFLRKCVEALEQNPNAVMCCTDLELIDKHGNEVQFGDEQLARGAHGIRPVGATASDRLRAITRAWVWFDIYGLLRREVVAQLRPLQPVWGCDVVFLVELCLRGEVISLPERLFSYRFLIKSFEERAGVLGPIVGRGAVAPSTSEFCLEMIRSVWLSPLGLARRCQLSWQLLVEFCMGNAGVNRYLVADFAPQALRAWSQGHVRRGLALLVIGGLGCFARAGHLLKRAARKFVKTTVSWLPSQRAISSAAPGVGRFEAERGAILAEGPVGERVAP